MTEIERLQELLLKRRRDERSKSKEYVRQVESWKKVVENAHVRQKEILRFLSAVTTKDESEM